MRIASPLGLGAFLVVVGAISAVALVDGLTGDEDVVLVVLGAAGLVLVAGFLVLLLRARRR